MKRLMLTCCVVLCALLVYVVYRDVRIAHEQKSALYQAKIEQLHKYVTVEQQWILQNQDESGALFFNHTDTTNLTVNPYFACLAGMGLLESETPSDAAMDCVRQYLQWHTERFYLESGVISDYKLVDGALLPTGKNDSVDSYIAMYIMLLCTYGEKGGNLTAIDPNGLVLNLAISNIESLWHNGLTTVRQGSTTCYTMDNFEVLASLIQLQTFLQGKGKSWFHHDSRDTLLQTLDTLIAQGQASIETLWNDAQQRYEVGVNTSNQVIIFHGWDAFYPDAVVQMYGTAFLRDANTIARAPALYQTFCDYHDWQTLNLDDHFYWASLSYVAARVGDTASAHQYLQHFADLASDTRSYPLYIAESGWVLRTCAELEQQYQAVIDQPFFAQLIDFIKEHFAWLQKQNV